MPLLSGYLIQGKVFSVFLAFLFIDSVSYWDYIALILYGWIRVWLRKHKKILKASYLSLRCPGIRRPTLRTAVRSFRRRIERFACKGLPSAVHLVLMNYKCMAIDFLTTSIEEGCAKLKLLLHALLILRDMSHPDPTSQPLRRFACLLIGRNVI